MSYIEQGTQRWYIEILIQATLHGAGRNTLGGGRIEVAWFLWFKN